VTPLERRGRSVKPTCCAASINASPVSR